MSLFREDLDATGCGSPGCTHDHSVLHLHSLCHPRAGIDAAYHKAQGALEMRCRKCQAFVAHVAVASREDEKP